jgi:hypothetical protein
MARKPVPKYVPLEQRPAFLASVEALPVDPAELEALARQAQQLYNDAVVAGDVERLDAAHDAYMAVVVRLNGSNPAGCGPIIGALDKALAAAPGHVPGWGQAGHFLLEVDGLRVQVVARSGTLENHCIHDLIAVDLDKPFPNESGRKSLYMTVTHHLGETFDQAVRRAVRELLVMDGQMVSIGADAKLLPSLAKRPGWLVDALAGVKPDGQLAMFGDAPPAKVPLTNAQRQKALRERRKQQQLKPVMLNELDRNVLRMALDAYDSFDGCSSTPEYRLGLLRRLVPGADWFPAEHRQCQQLKRLHEAEVGRWVRKSQEGSQESSRWAAKAREWEAQAKAAQALEKENALLENERNGSLAAVQTLTERLRRAGLCTDYRKQPGE